MARKKTGRTRFILSISVDHDVIDYLDHISKETRVSKSVIVNDILVDYIKDIKKKEVKDV